MLQVSDLSFDYQDRPLLNQVDFTVLPGQLLHLRGKNGVGKTTLLKLLAGLLHPISGGIHYEGTPIQQNLSAYQQNTCYVSHKSGVSALLTLRENYHFSYYSRGKKADFEKYLELFDLTESADKPCGQLSLGQVRRVSLMRLMMTQAPLWLLDEPFVTLDKEAVVLLMDRIKNHLRCSGLVVMTSHQDLNNAGFEIQEYCL